MHTITMTDGDGTSYTRPYASLLAAYRRSNDRGDGFDPGPESERGRLIYSAQTADEVSVYNDDDGILLVGDANGDWAVRMDWQQVEALD